jgi:8-oxo-dGTP diphosphatase
MNRRFGEAVRTGKTYKRRPGVYAVLLSGNSALLTFQDQPKPEFQLPGGGIDRGEQPIAALHREVMEETGWRIGPPRFVGVYRRFTFMEEYDFWAEKVCTVYVARPLIRVGPPTERGHTAVWLPVSSAASLLENKGDNAMFHLALAGSGPR